MLTERPWGKYSAGRAIYYRDLRVGWGATAETAYDRACETLGEYIVTCREALDMLDFEQRTQLPFDAEVLVSASPLRLWFVDDGVELVRSTLKGRYALSRVKGHLTPITARQLFESALIGLEIAQAECEQKIPA